MLKQIAAKRCRASAGLGDDRLDHTFLPHCGADMFWVVVIVYYSPFRLFLAWGVARAQPCSRRAGARLVR